MKEKELIALGFNRRDVTAEESGEENDWHYYEINFGDGHLGLISSSNDEVENGEWSVEIFETTPAIKFKDAKKLSNLILGITLLEKQL